MQKIRETSKSERGNSVETEACNYRKFELQRTSSGADRVSVYNKVYGLQAELQF